MVTTLDCSAVREQLWDLHRGRLSNPLQQAMLSHFEICEACRLQSEEEQSLDALLSQLPRKQPSPEFKLRMQELIASPRKEPSRIPNPRRAIWTLAGTLSLVACLAVVMFVRDDRDRSRLLDEAVNDHLRVVYAQQPLEVQSSEIHQVKPWFTGRLDFAPALSFAGDEEFPLQGGLVAYYIDRKAAAFVFKRRMHVITALVFPSSNLPWPLHGSATVAGLEASTQKKRGFNALLWRDADLGYVLVSDVAESDLMRLGQKIVAANRR
ncbi:MAG TPA: zf-HC2 domain-containing protein [Polyangiaceae bacterium]